MAATEDELLRMSMGGEPPASAAAAFEAEKAVGNECFASGDYDGALTHYRAAGAADPSSAIPLANASMALLRLRRPADAVEAANTALSLLALHPDRPGSLQLSVKTLLRRAAARRQLSLFALVAHDLEEILLLQPGHEEATRLLRELHTEHRTELARASTSRRIEEVDEPSANGISVQHDGVLTGYQAGPRHPAQPIPPTAVDATRRRRRNQQATREIDATVVSGPGDLMLPTTVLANMTDSLVSKSPQNGSEFERTWRSLRTHNERRGRYIVFAVGAARIRRSLLGEMLTAQLIMEIASALTALIDEDMTLCESVVSVMEALTHVARFDMIVLFLSRTDKDLLMRLIDVLQDAIGDDDSMMTMRTKFGLST